MRVRIVVRGGCNFAHSVGVEVEERAEAAVEVLVVIEDPSSIDLQ